MMPPEDLSRYTATAETGAGFTATKDGLLVMLTPITPRATAWLHENVGDDATWLDDTLVVEVRYFGDLADAIMDAGFLFERSALPN